MNAVHAAAAARSPNSRGRILVVDDDRLVLATIAHGLSEAGYEVIDADNGDDAILLAREHRPELALLDIRMEGLNGFDVAQTLRSAYRIPFMFLSAFADAETLAKVQELGALDYLVKPLGVGQILPRVTEVLARVRSTAIARDDVFAPPPQPLQPLFASALGIAAGAGVGAGAEAGAGAVASPADAAAAAAPAAVADTVADTVALAMGVLMHRHSLTRLQAGQRLQRLASDQGRDLTQQAERLLSAVEELARSGG